MARRIQQLLWVPLILCWTVSATAQLRFPPPEFEGGYKMPATTTPPARGIGMQYLDVVLLAACLGVALWLIYKRRSRRGMFWLSLFSLGYFGFYRKGCICPIGSPQNIAYGLFNPDYAIPWSVLAFFILPLAVALFAGRAFCAGVCPQGALQDVVLIKPVKVPSWLEHGLGIIPFIFLGAGLACAATGAGFVICRFDPFVPLFRLSGSAFILAAGATFLVLGMFVGRPYCRFLCPYGALLKLASLVSKWRVRVTPDFCTQCRLCEDSCPFGIIREPSSGKISDRMLGGERRRMSLLLVTLPILIAAGAWGALKFSPVAARLDPQVVLAERYLEQKQHPLSYGVMTSESLSQARAERNPEAILARADAARARFRVASVLFGGWAGLVLGMKLIALSMQQKRTDYEPDRGACFACARCFGDCPNERTRLGLITSAEAPVLASDSVDSKRRAFERTALIAAAFCLVVGVTLLAIQLSARPNERWNTLTLAALKGPLANDPGNEQLKQQIRAADVQVRTGIRHRISIYRSGAWMLLGGAVIFLVVGRRAARVAKEYKFLVSAPDREICAAQHLRPARWAVAGVGTIGALALVAVVLTSKPVLTAQASVSRGETGNAAFIALPTLAEFQMNYPRFRGWDGSGFSSNTNASLSWDGKTGAGIAWKSPMLAPGHSSPVVWSNRLFITGGTAARREVFAYDTASGQLLWRRAVESVPGSPAKVPEIPEATGYAACTSATDGRLVFVIFGNGDLAAVSIDGAVAWSKAFGPLKNPYGHATSLAIWPGMLLVQLDQGDNGPANSKLLALEPVTGRVLWERNRPVGASWATPIVIEPDRKAQVVTLAVPWVIAYARESGEELWRAELMEGEVVPSPVFAGGQIVISSPSARLLALQPNGAGDVTKKAVTWSTQDNAPDITSPVSDGKLVFAAGSSGNLTCFDLANGKTLWEHDLQTQVQSSPAILGNRLFVLGTEGTALVIEVGRQYKEIARSNLPDKFLASPAFANGLTFLRGTTNLYCIKSVKAL